MRCPTTGTALERREAPGPSQGPPRPGTPTPLKAYGSRNLGADRLSQSRWGVSQTPRRLPALQPLFLRGKEKRDAGQPRARNIKEQGRRSVG